MTFSRAHSKIRAVEIKQRRAKIQARRQHPDMKRKHPGWCVDANKGQYVILLKVIKEECEKAQMRVERFREKLFVPI